MRPLILGTSFECLHRGFDKEGHESKLAAVLGHKLLLHLLAQLHDGSHVDFVEGRQDGRCLLGVDEMAGDLAAQHAHLAPGGAAVVLAESLTGTAQAGPALRTGPDGSWQPGLLRDYWCWNTDRRRGLLAALTLASGMLTGSAVLCGCCAWWRRTLPRQLMRGNDRADIHLLTLRDVRMLSTPASSASKLVGNLVRLECGQGVPLGDLEPRRPCANDQYWLR